MSETKIDLSKYHNVLGRKHQYYTITFSNKVKRALWHFVESLLFRPFAGALFNKWRLLILKLFGASVQNDSGVYASARIWAPWNLKLGHNAWIGPHVECYNVDYIELADNVTVSQWAYLCTASHDTSKINNPASGLIIAPIIIRRNAWIGAKAFIGMGVEIGANSIVGAMAAVFKDVEENTIVGGNPAKFIKKRILK